MGNRRIPVAGLGVPTTNYMPPSVGAFRGRLPWAPWAIVAPNVQRCLGALKLRGEPNSHGEPSMPWQPRATITLRDPPRQSNACDEAQTTSRSLRLCPSSVSGRGRGGTTGRVSIEGSDLRSPSSSPPDSGALSDRGRYPDGGRHRRREHSHPTNSRIRHQTAIRQRARNQPCQQSGGELEGSGGRSPRPSPGTPCGPAPYSPMSMDVLHCANSAKFGNARIL
jgi:hypothetical protein